MRKISKQELASLTSQLRKAQRNCCALCGKPFTAKDGPVADHDHTTGVIRGILHRSCNGAEGKVKVQAMKSHAGVKPYEYLIQLGKYLERHKTPQLTFIHPDHETKRDKMDKANKRAREKRALLKRS